jgi:hypothetical protein
MALRAKEIKRDYESFISGAQALALGADGTARKMRGIEHFIQTNKSSGTGYAFTNSTTALTDGTLRNITEAMVLDTMESAWSNGGEPTLLVCGSAIKRKISGFAGRTGTQVAVKKDEVVASVDVYVTDFGDLKVMPSRHVRARTVLILDPSKLRKATFRGYEWSDLAVTGDAVSKLLTAEMAVQVDTELAHGKVSDVQ